MIPSISHAARPSCTPRQRRRMLQNSHDDDGMRIMRRLTGCVEPWKSRNASVSSSSSSSHSSPAEQSRKDGRVPARLKRAHSVAFPARGGDGDEREEEDEDDVDVSNGQSEKERGSPRTNFLDQRLIDGVRRAVLACSARYRMPCVPTSILVPSMQELRTGKFKCTSPSSFSAECPKWNGIGGMWKMDGPCLWRTAHERSFFHAFTFLQGVAKGCKHGTRRITQAWAESHGMSTRLMTLDEAEGHGGELVSISPSRAALQDVERILRTNVIDPVLHQDLRMDKQRSNLSSPSEDADDSDDASHDGETQCQVVWDDQGHGSFMHAFAWSMDRKVHQCLIERDLVDRFACEDAEGDLEVVCRSMVLLAREMSACKPRVNIIFCASDIDGEVRVVEDTHPEVSCMHSVL